MGSVIQMYGAISGGAQPGLASIDVPTPGRLLGVQWALRWTLAGADSYVQCHLSFRTSATPSTNDDRGVLSQITSLHDFTTSGGAELGINMYTQLPEVPVMGGERLYIHAESTAAVGGIVLAMLHFDFDMDKISMRRR